MQSSKGDGDGSKPQVSRSTLRLTIKVSDKGFDLVSVERLPMITPPQVGERPELGKHGGHWVALESDQRQLLAHRVIDRTLLDSTEVHSPDGKIERHFGPPGSGSGIFEVLLPDLPGARHVVIAGEPLQPKKGAKTQPSAELARFDLSAHRPGGKP